MFRKKDKERETKFFEKFHLIHDDVTRHSAVRWMDTEGRMIWRSGE
jgi:hypothetical protein